MLNLLPDSLIKVVFFTVLCGFWGCAKSNYLTVGETATIEDKDGMYLRRGPNVNAAKILVVPKGKQVSVIAEGEAEKLFDIKSKWYRVRYGRYEGWMWGGLATSKSALNNDKSQSYSASLGKYDGLLDYAQKTFKQISVVDKSKPTEPGDHCLPQPNHELFLFEQGANVETELVGPHCHPSSNATLKLPKASFEDGLNILIASGIVAKCGSLSFEQFRSANYDSSNLKHCKKEEYSFYYFKMHREGSILVLETSVGGV